MTIVAIAFWNQTTSWSLRCQCLSLHLHLHSTLCCSCQLAVARELRRWRSSSSKQRRRATRAAVSRHRANVQAVKVTIAGSPAVARKYRYRTKRGLGSQRSALRLSHHLQWEHQWTVHDRDLPLMASDDQDFSHSDIPDRTASLLSDTDTFTDSLTP